MLVITPSCRPERLSWILKNWNRQQKAASDRLLIVWNNCEVPDPPDIRGVMTTHSDPGIGAAMDCGIQFGVRTGHRSWACFDDDDWYGPGALTVAKRGLDDFDVVGRDSKFYRTSFGEMWLLSNLVHNWPSASFGLATMAGTLELVGTRRDMKFDDGGPSWGVETRWLERLRNQPLGRRVSIGLLPPQEFVHCRWQDVAHTTEVTDAVIAFAFAKVTNYGKHAVEDWESMPELEGGTEVEFGIAQQFYELQESARWFASLKVTPV